MMMYSIPCSIFQQSQQSCIQPLSGPPPTPTTKTQHWQVAMYEFQKYRQNINAMLEQMGGGKPYHLVEFDKTPKLAKESKLLKPKDEKQGSNNGNSNGMHPTLTFPTVETAWWRAFPPIRFQSPTTSIVKKRISGKEVSTLSTIYADGCKFSDF